MDGDSGQRHKETIKWQANCIKASPKNLENHEQLFQAGLNPILVFNAASTQLQRVLFNVHRRLNLF